MCVACLTVFVNCLTKQFAICLSAVVILWLNVMVWLEVVYWINRVWSSKEWVCCACDLSVRLDAPSICLFVFSYVKVISSFKSLRAVSQVFSLLMLFLCVMLHTMWSRKSLQVLCMLHCACLPSI